MPSFKNREEYERWKAERAAGGTSTPAPPAPAPSPTKAGRGPGGGMRWAWTVETDAPHDVAAEIGLSGSETVLVDGQVVSESRSWKMRNEHTFPVGPGHTGRLTVEASLGGAVTCRLFVDGHEIAPVRGAARQSLKLDYFGLIGAAVGFMVVELNAAEWFPRRGPGIDWGRAAAAGIGAAVGGVVFQLLATVLRGRRR